MARALILAAGQGTRLRPLTDAMPKAFVPLLGRPMIERQVAALAAAGLSPIRIVTGYQAAHFDRLGLPTTFNPRFATTNMVESLMAARDYVSQPGDLVVSYGDIACERRVVDALLGSEGEIAVTVDLGWRQLWETRFADPLSDAETLVMGPNDRLIELGRKATDYDRIQAQYIGLFKVRGDRTGAFVDFYDRLDPEALYEGRPLPTMFMTTFLQALIDAGWDVRAAPVQHGWVEIDSIEDLNAYERLHAEGRLAALYRAD